MHWKYFFPISVGKSKTYLAFILKNITLCNLTGLAAIHNPFALVAQTIYYTLLKNRLCATCASSNTTAADVNFNRLKSLITTIWTLLLSLDSVQVNGRLTDNVIAAYLYYLEQKVFHGNKDLFIAAAHSKLLRYADDNDFNELVNYLDSKAAELLKK